MSRSYCKSNSIIYFTFIDCLEKLIFIRQCEIFGVIILCILAVLPGFPLDKWKFNHKQLGNECCVSMLQIFTAILELLQIEP